jgi:cytochrome bd-type quinol oxidase subunit 2
MMSGRENDVLGRIFQWGSVAGISVAFGALLSLLIQDGLPADFSLAAAFAPGAQFAKRVLCGAGILLLAATPLIGLGWLGLRAVREGRHRRARLTAALFALCLAAALIASRGA